MHDKLLYFAKTNKEPMAAIVREFIEEGLKRAQVKNFSGKDNLQAISNLNLAGGPKDLSKNIDHYLYGAPRKK